MLAHPQNNLRLWIAPLLFFLIHQLEEVFINMRVWAENHGVPLWLFPQRNALPQSEHWTRDFGLITLGQLILLIGLAFLVRKHNYLTKLAITLLLALLIFVFCWHIGLSIYTDSIMPGTYTSIVTGIPVAVLLIYKRWHPTQRKII